MSHDTKRRVSALEVNIVEFAWLCAHVLDRKISEILYGEYSELLSFWPQCCKEIKNKAQPGVMSKESIRWDDDVILITLIPHRSGLFSSNIMSQSVLFIIFHSNSTTLACFFYHYWIQQQLPLIAHKAFPLTGSKRHPKISNKHLMKKIIIVLITHIKKDLCGASTILKVPELLWQR